MLETKSHLNFIEKKAPNIFFFVVLFIFDPTIGYDKPKFVQRQEWVFNSFQMLTTVCVYIQVVVCTVHC